MSDNDLIRRGDALAFTRDPFGAETVTSQAINALPAVQPTVSPDVAALVEALDWAMSHLSAMPMDEASQSEFRRHRAALARVKGVM